MTDVALFGGSLNLDNMEQLADSMELTADEGARGGNVSYMSFSGKMGTYSIGQEKREPGEDEMFLLSITGFELGYMVWKSSKPIATRMANAAAGRPVPAFSEEDLEEMGPFDENRGEGMARARRITIKSLDNDEQCEFTSTSKSGVAVMADLQKEVIARMRGGQPCWPVISFGREQFEANGFKNFKPKVDIHKWLSNEQIQAAIEAEDTTLLLEQEDDTPPKQARQKRKL